VKLLNLNLQVW